VSEIREGNTPVAEQEKPKTIIFDDVEETLLLFANAFLLQGTDDPHVFVLNIGQYATPIIAGTNDERAEVLRSLTAVHAKTLARLVVTPDKLGALAEILRQFVEMVAATQQNAEGEGDSNA